MGVRLLALGLACFALADVSDARALDYPTRPVKLVVGFPAGGPTDVLARLVGQCLAERLGQQFIVENIAGAGGMTGASRVVQASPDGYRILFGGSGNLTFNQILYKKPLFNALTDVTPVALLTEQALVLIARKDLPVAGLQDFARHVKGNKSATFGSAGAGRPPIWAAPCSTLRSAPRPHTCRIAASSPPHAAITVSTASSPSFCAILWRPEKNRLAV